MGMGSSPVGATCISKESLTRLCTPQMRRLESLLKRLKIDWGALAQLLDESSPYWRDHDAFDLTGRQLERLEARWRDVQDVFARATLTQGACLEVAIGHYSREDGDRYDDLEESFYFAVEGVHQLTPAGERFKEMLEDKMWTVFG